MTNESEARIINDAIDKIKAECKDGNPSNQKLSEILVKLFDDAKSDGVGEGVERAAMSISRGGTLN